MSFDVSKLAKTSDILFVKERGEYDMDCWRHQGPNFLNSDLVSHEIV